MSGARGAGMTAADVRLIRLTGYMDGFRRSDHDTILGCLTDGVVWRIHGFRTTRTSRMPVRHLGACWAGR